MNAELSGGAIIAVIVGMGLVNFVLRGLPVAILSRLDLPRPFRHWLSFVPIAVMGALVASEVLVRDGRATVSLTDPAVLASAVTMLAFRFTRSFVGAAITGMAAFVLLKGLPG